MKYLVISDIHGSLSGAQCMIDAFDHHNCSRILCLGDVLYHGPRNDLPEDYAPKKVIEIMNSKWHDICAVRGNCDAEVDQMVLQFALTADYQVFQLGQRRVFMSHGHVYGPDHLPKMEEGDIFLSGHTHIPTAIKTEGIYLLNPGSSALPKQNHPKSYAVLDEEGFTVYTAYHQEYMHVSF